MNPILLTAAGNPQNQDRGLILHDGARVVLCVADGAGGLSGGAEAAILAVDMVRQNASLLVNADACAELMRSIDAAVSKDSIPGETTCALAVLTSEEIFGASVGDSGIWIVPEIGDHLNLTQAQQRQPFIGSGNAWPIPFQHATTAGSLLLATDGLLKYTSAERILAVCREHSVDIAGQRLIDLVRYSSGAFPDDVTLILARI